MHTRQEKLEAFGRLLDVMDTLREQCPWDRKQTNESLRTNTVEEVYELSDALLAGAPSEIKKELGDVLLHIVFYSRIASEGGHFDVADVCHALCDKLIYRHPHIYGEVKADDAETVLKNWEQLKQSEAGGNKTVLSGVPRSLPSLIKAYRMQEKASGVGFDWSEPAGAWSKFVEELAEVEDAIASGDRGEVEAELGDLLFSLVNLSRLLGINPDNALERTNEKFARRFGYVEAETIKAGKRLQDLTLEEMDALWDEAKSLEGSTPWSRPEEAI